MVVLLLLTLPSIVFLIFLCATAPKASRGQNKQASLNLSSSVAKFNSQTIPSPTGVPNTSETPAATVPTEEKREEKSGVKKEKKTKEKSGKGVFKFEGNVEDEPESIHTNLDSVKGEKNPLLSKRVQERLKGRSVENLTKEKTTNKNAGEKNETTDKGGPVIISSAKGALVRSLTYRQHHSKVMKKEHNMEEIVAEQKKKSAEPVNEEKVVTPKDKSMEKANSNHSGYMGI